MKSDVTYARRLDDGDGQEVEILRTGEWDHPLHGRLVIDLKTLQDMKRHFDEGRRGQDIAIDYDHEVRAAAGWIRALAIRADGDVHRLIATVEWTGQGLQDVREKNYRYLSADFRTKWTDNESGEVFENILFGAALTNRPFVKNMAPITPLAEPAEARLSERICLSERGIESGDEGTDPDRAVELQGAGGVKFVIGRLKGEGSSTVQTVVFDKESWTRASASDWLKEHELRSDKVDETESSLRYRQRDPGDFTPGSFRTITPGGARDASALAEDRKKPSLSLGGFVRARRRSLGMSAESLAAKIGCTPSGVYHIENGQTRRPPMSVLEKLAGALSTTFNHVAGHIPYELAATETDAELVENELGKFISNKREEKGLTLEALAQAAKIDPEVLKSIEDGSNRQPSLAQLEAIAKALEADPTDLVARLQPADAPGGPPTEAGPAFSGRATALDPTEDNPMKQLKEVLKLNESATEQDVLNAVQTLLSDASSLNDVRSELGLKEGESVLDAVKRLTERASEAETKATQLTEQAAKREHATVSLTEYNAVVKQVEDLQTKFREKDAEVFLTENIRLGRIAPASKDKFRKLFMADPAEARDLVATIPDGSHRFQEDGTGAPAAETTLDERIDREARRLMEGDASLSYRDAVLAAADRIAD